MQEHSRRAFVRRTGAVAAAAAWPPVAVDAASERDRPPTLVAVYLRGGTDALSTVVPYADARYPELRPNIHVPGPGDGRRQGLALDSRFAFNPNMGSLHALYERGMCAPIVCAGSPHPTRSHFEAQDFMERAAPGMEQMRTGWLNRYLEETRGRDDPYLRAFCLQPSLPESLRGKYPVLARPDEDARRAMRIFRKLYGMEGRRRGPGADILGRQAKRKIDAYGVETIERLRRLNYILEKMPSEGSYPDSGFGRKMRDIAKIIKSGAGLEVTALDYGGWDDHKAENPVEGRMGRRLGDVSETIGAFAEDLGPRMNKVLVLLMSEFGREVEENKNRGTGHGHGGFMLAVGGMVNGPQVYGRFTGLEKERLYRGRDLPVHTDFRSVFAESLHALFGYDGIRQGLFPEYSRERPPVNFLRAVRS